MIYSWDMQSDCNQTANYTPHYGVGELHEPRTGRKEGRKFSRTARAAIISPFRVVRQQHVPEGGRSHARTQFGPRVSVNCNLCPGSVDFGTGRVICAISYTTDGLR